MSSQPPPPVSPLARYRFLSKLAGVPVSPLCLGGMSIGDKWEMGSMNKESSMELLDAYFDVCITKPPHSRVRESDKNCRRAGILSTRQTTSTC
jgi:hypothetical protein